MADILFTLAIVMAAVAMVSLLVSLVMRRYTTGCVVVFAICFTLFFVFLIVGGNINKASSANSEHLPSAEATIEAPAAESVDLSVTYDDIYLDYKKNELAADDIYKGNRYQVTAAINGLSTSGLFNLTGGATLTMQTQVDNTIVFFLAEFEKEQEEALKRVVVGDTITFEGKCLSDEMWTECKLIE